MYERVLVPTDGSDAARAAANEAIDLAAAFDATVHVIYVIDESASNLLLSTSMEDSIDAMAKQGDTATDEIAEMARNAGVQVEADVIRGMQIHEAIVDYASDNDVDIIVMGTFGRRGVEHVVGSTTERVLGAAPMPVLSVAVTDATDEK